MPARYLPVFVTNADACEATYACSALHRSLSKTLSQRKINNEQRPGVFVWIYALQIKEQKMAVVSIGSLLVLVVYLSQLTDKLLICWLIVGIYHRHQHSFVSKRVI